MSAAKKVNYKETVTGSIVLYKMIRNPLSIGKQLITQMQQVWSQCQAPLDYCSWFPWLQAFWPVAISVKSWL
jgi:hypothetical protein